MLIRILLLDKFCRMFRRSNVFKDKSGQAITEYVFLLALVAIVSLIALSFMLNKGYGIAFNKYKNLLATPYHYE